MTLRAGVCVIRGMEKGPYSFLLFPWCTDPLLFCLCFPFLCLHGVLTVPHFCFTLLCVTLLFLFLLACTWLISDNPKWSLQILSLHDVPISFCVFTLECACVFVFNFQNQKRKISLAYLSQVSTPAPINSYHRMEGSRVRYNWGCSLYSMHCTGKLSKKNGIGKMNETPILAPTFQSYGRGQYTYVYIILTQDRSW